VKKKTIVLALSVGTLVLLGFVGRTTFSSGQAVRESPEGVRVARGEIASFVKATGVVKPSAGAEVRVGAQVSGVMKRLRVRVGDAVEKGQSIAELDDRRLAATFALSVAALKSAQAEQSFALSDMARKQTLATREAIPRSDLELAERARALAEASVAQARASLALAKTQLDDARIIAPIRGVVAATAIQEGETVGVSPIAPPFVTLIDLTRLEVWAYVDETDVGRVQVGQKVRFTVDAYSDHEIEGQVSLIYPKPEIRDNVVNYVAVVRFAPPQEQTIRPEMTASVRIELQSRSDVLLVPRRAVHREGGRSYVIRGQGKTASRQYVTTGSRDETHWEVVDGLAEGDEIQLADLNPDLGT
jgi:HlyD family secretion protein